MAPFESLYIWPCKSPACWLEGGDKLVLSQDVAQMTTEKILVIRDRMRQAQSKQKS